MGEVEVKCLIEGGKASGGPPLGTTFGPMGINVQTIVDEINEKTKDFEGMKVPVKVIVNKETKNIKVEVGSPSTSALIKKELGIEKAKLEEGKTGPVADIELEKLVGIAKAKMGSSLAKTLKSSTCETTGVCVSMNMTVNGKKPQEVIKEIHEGKHDSFFN